MVGLTGCVLDCGVGKMVSCEGVLWKEFEFVGC